MNSTRTLDADVVMDQENGRRGTDDGVGEDSGGGGGAAGRRDHDAKRQAARDSFIERVARDGFRNTRIEDVCRDAGVSHREFYRWFGNKDQCYLSIFEEFSRALIDVGQRVFTGTVGSWEEKMRAGLLVTMRKLADTPHQARFIIECHAANGGEAAAWRLIDDIKRQWLSSEVRSQAPRVPAASESIAFGVVIEPIRRYLEEGVAEGEDDPLPGLVAWIVYYLTLYLFGPERAEAQRPQPGSEAR